jgi:hypothetical protein
LIVPVQNGPTVAGTLVPGTSVPVSIGHW